MVVSVSPSFQSQNQYKVGRYTSKTFVGFMTIDIASISVLYRRSEIKSDVLRLATWPKYGVVFLAMLTCGLNNYACMCGANDFSKVDNQLGFSSYVNFVFA